MTSLLTLLFIAVFVYTQLPLSDGVEGKIPAPTEIIQKKKDRKKFKQDRKNYYEQMHKTAPDEDWRKMEALIRLSEKTFAFPGECGPCKCGSGKIRQLLHAFGSLYFSTAKRIRHILQNVKRYLLRKSF